MRSNHSPIAILALLTGTAVVRGQSEPLAATAHLDIRAAPTCSTESDLAARIAARSPRVRFVTEGARYSIRADFSPSRRGGVESNLTLVGPGAKSSSRTLVAGTCAEAADAVALIIAVTLDPASLDDVRDSASMTSPAANSEAKTENSRLIPNPNDGTASTPDRSFSPAPTPASTANPPKSKPDAMTERPARRQSTEPASRWQFGLLGFGQLLFGPAPAPMPGLSLYASASLERNSILAPTMLLGVTHAWRSGLAQLGGTASFRLDVAQIDACALRFRVSKLESRWCGSLLAGTLTAQGTNTLDPSGSIGRPFAAVGASTLLSTRLGENVELSSRIGASANLVVDSFEFGSTVFHKVSPVTLSVGLGMGVQLP